jgi:hypothetical protein
MTDVTNNTSITSDEQDISMTPDLSHDHLVTPALDNPSDMAEASDQPGDDALVDTLDGDMAASTANDADDAANTAGIGAQPGDEAGADALDSEMDVVEADAIDIGDATNTAGIGAQPDDEAEADASDSEVDGPGQSEPLDPSMVIEEAKREFNADVDACEDLAEIAFNLEKSLGDAEETRDEKTYDFLQSAKNFRDKYLNTTFLSTYIISQNVDPIPDGRTSKFTPLLKALLGLGKNPVKGESAA